MGEAAAKESGDALVSAALPIAQRVARKFSGSRLMRLRFDVEDLTQEALTAIWQAWCQHEARSLPELRKLGATVARNKMADMYRTTVRGRHFVPELFIQGRSYELVGESEVEIRLDMQSMLSPTDKLVLAELSDPSEEVEIRARALRRQIKPLTLPQARILAVSQLKEISLDVINQTIQKVVKYVRNEL